jgi:hypothetical protein
MPFDTTVYMPLLDTLRKQGIIPIEHEIFEAHKTSEMAKYPGSLCVRYAKPIQRFIGINAIIGLVAYSVAVIIFAVNNSWLFNPSLQAITLFIASILSLWALIVVITTTFFMFKRFKKPAYWRVEIINSPFSRYIPTGPIRTVAKTAIANAPSGSYFEIGFLIHDELVVDPFLTICYGNESYCLAIWQDEQIFHIAHFT